MEGVGLQTCANWGERGWSRKSLLQGTGPAECVVWFQPRNIPSGVCAAALTWPGRGIPAGPAMVRANASDPDPLGSARALGTDHDGSATGIVRTNSCDQGPEDSVPLG